LRCLSYYPNYIPKRRKRLENEHKMSLYELSEMLDELGITDFYTRDRMRRVHFMCKRLRTRDYFYGKGSAHTTNFRKQKKVILK